MTDARIVAALQRNPQFCACMAAPDAPSTHRGAVHLGRCRHSTLRDTTRGWRPLPRLRPVTGRRGFVADYA